MAEDWMLLGDTVTFEEIRGEKRFWNYFLTYAFFRGHNRQQEERLMEYMSLHYPMDCAWNSEFTTCKVKNDRFEFVKMLAFNRSRYQICFYEDRIEYTRMASWQKKEPIRRMGLKEFRKITKTWDATQCLLLCPLVLVEKKQEEKFLRIVREGLRGLDICGADADVIAQMILECRKKTEEETAEDKTAKRTIRGVSGFLIIGAISFVVHKALPTTSWIGEEGLRRAVVNGFVYLPAMLYMIIGAIVGIICMNINSYRLEKEKHMSSIESGKGIARFLGVAMILLICIWVKVTVRDVSIGAGALIDQKNLTVRAIVLEEPTVKVHKRSYGKNAYKGPLYFEIKADNLEKSFKIPASYKLKDAIEAQVEAGEEITVYYYEHSRVVKKVCGGEEVLVGE